MSEKLNHNYSNIEEKLNVLTHGFGLLLAMIALPLLILKSVFYQGFWQIASFSIFGFSLIILYAASTFYHAAKNAKIRRRLNIFDHAAIYVLIAGSYTPFCLVILPEKTGWYLFIFVWLFALTGVILKLFFTGKFDKLSTALYLIMGWQVIFLINPLMENLPYNGLFYLIAGGVFYTIGAVLYSIKKVPYNHAIFHVFVLLGSFSHFWAIYKYV
ncbi:hemolysin III family protein [Tenacibaculum piscium]|uniref:PAQR family membrane homeostasis protein TrhA n=1 Tax=Tenacibaculum piscium TaxID=1458515 RepID=UPI00187B6618|nr:hemolysin III family protein [Tenacibaculum piscium]MBE7685567.1 hemolysin III family protein [Tenacibaculum piscium]MBE7690151.1 hemolysin III family protein [Tenacibaculum piscium]